MLTPLDIENIKFKKQMMGYNTLEVEEFLTALMEDYEALYKENNELKEKLNLFGDTIAHYKSMEDMLNHTLIVAQTTGEEIKRTAMEKADAIIKDGEIKAEQIALEAHKQLANVQFQYEDAKRNFLSFKAKFEALLYTQKNLLRDIMEDSNELAG
ncbi:MAG: DivIVA domain-containing protein [Hyphomonadaceae bacterium]|nr:DivIVA domain-containing protein [Clostridia bacterium]